MLTVPPRGSSNNVADPRASDVKLADPPEMPFKGNKEPLIYPLDNQDRYPASITFQPYKIQPPSISESAEESISDGLTQGLQSATESRSSQGTKLVWGEIAQDIIDFFDIDTTSQTQKEIVSKASASSEDTVVTNRDYIISGAFIKLYVPTALTFNDGLNYDTPALGFMGGSAFNTASNGAGILSSMGTAIGSGAKSVMDLLVGNTSSGSDIARLTALRTADAFKSSAVSEGASIAFAVTMNPNTRASFKGVSMREFSFTFKFLPKSKEESVVVADLIQRFRVAAYPETISAAGLNVGYKYPDLFDIKIKYNNTRVGQKFQKCFLKGVNTTYNPNSMTFHKDGSPAEIDLTLNFIEEKTLDRASIEEGY